MRTSPATAYRRAGRHAGFTLLELLLVILIISILAALFISTQERTQWTASRASCKNNLRQMHTGMHMYVSSYGKNKFFPPHTGDAFLNCLRGRCGPHQGAPLPYEQRAPLPSHDDLFVCPSTGNVQSPTELDYAGPNVTGLKTPYLNDSLPPERIIAGDRRLSNHKNEGGNVLRFDGSVQFYAVDEYQAVTTIDKEK
jgi:prepilin-type N-terminal cleavage/methylation domain-containing protein